MGKGERPEHVAPPELFYDDTEAAKYTTSSRVMEIQEKLTARALELLALPEDGIPKFILDVGCGSGLSGQVLSEQGDLFSASLRLPLTLSVVSVAAKQTVHVQATSGWVVTFRRPCSKLHSKKRSVRTCCCMTWEMDFLSSQVHLMAL